MPSTASQRATITPSTPPSTPRLLLAPARVNQAVLDGGWWPRSWDPVAELPGLVLALAARYGPIRYLMLNDGAWDRRFRKLVVGPGVIRTGWFATLDATLLIATTDVGDQVDLLVVPPSSSPVVAEQAMTMAADPTNTMRAPDILAATIAAAAIGDDARAVRDNEGGRPENGPRRTTKERATVETSG